jgi:hypothetical protein
MSVADSASIVQSLTPFLADFMEGVAGTLGVTSDTVQITGVNPSDGHLGISFGVTFSTTALPIPDIRSRWVSV